MAMDPATILALTQRFNQTAQNTGRTMPQGLINSIARQEQMAARAPAQARPAVGGAARAQPPRAGGRAPTTLQLPNGRTQTIYGRGPQGTIGRPAAPVAPAGSATAQGVAAPPAPARAPVAPAPVQNTGTAAGGAGSAIGGAIGSGLSAARAVAPTQAQAGLDAAQAAFERGFNRVTPTAPTAPTTRIPSQGTLRTY